MIQDRERGFFEVECFVFWFDSLVEVIGGIREVGDMKEKKLKTSEQSFI